MNQLIEHELEKCTTEYEELTKSSQLSETFDANISLAKKNLICPYMPLILKKIITLFSAGTHTVDEFKGQLFSILTSAPLLAMENRDNLGALLNHLTDELLLRSADALNSARVPVPYAAAITRHYVQLRGLRAHVREDMASFVDLYNKTNSLRQVSTQQSDYLRFFEDYSAVLSDADKNHSETHKFILAETGADVMRRMMLMGTHLLQILILWGKIDS